MRRDGSGLIYVAIFLFLLDIYIFQIVKYFSQNFQPKTRVILYVVFWLITVLTLLALFILPTLYADTKWKSFVMHGFAIIIGLTIFKLLLAAFMLIDDVRRLFAFTIDKVKAKPVTVDQSTNITRSAFLSWLGLGISTTVFGTMLLGFSNKYNYQVKRIKLKFANLPKAFSGLKIVQISDIHSGSFNNKEAVTKGIEKIMLLKPDIILFTGDLVNDRVAEIEPYMDVFSKLSAPLGVYSILGNHDYGDYYPWSDRDETYKEKENSERLKLANSLANENTIPQDIKDGLINSYRLHSPLQAANLVNLKQAQAQMGWQLLINENKVFEKNGEKIALLGIENWGARGRFPKYGRMDLANKNLDDITFKILMSHDPSHWDAQVIKNHKDIDLTLSGHTHGMQFGVEIPGFKWSPVQYMYKRWAGLYAKDNQKLYINRGFGFLGYPGRVGILPEITLLELETQA
jgi:uncharacterized protein